MLNDDVHDDEEDEEVILDRRDLIHKANYFNSSSNSGPILLGINRFNVRIDNDPNKLSKEKAILLAVTCISIGMFTGLLGPTFPFLAESLSTKLSSVIWLIAVKAIGFLIGTFLSSYLYTWFNICCLLGLSCMSISFGVCSLPFLADLTAFYLASLILGIALAISYHGIDAFYNHLWARPSVRWLHLLVALGAILSTLILLRSTISNNENSLLTTNSTQSPRLRREVEMNMTEAFSLPTTIQSTSTPLVKTEKLTTQSICIKSYCCYYRNETVFNCQEQKENQSNDCLIIVSSRENSTSEIRIIDMNNITCRMDRICGDEKKPKCSRQLIDAVINTNSSTVTVSSTDTTNLPSTTKTNPTTIITSTKTITPSTTIHHDKPSVAESATDDQSKNLLYFKIRSFLQSITSVHILYLFLTISFLFLGIFYSILAMRGENIDSSSITNLNPLSLLFVKSHRMVNNSNSQISLSSDRSSLKFVFLLILFYFILSGIESSCTYLTYLFGLNLKFQETKSLFIQFFYLFGRLMDILFNYGLLLFHKHMKKQSDLISVKFLICIRLSLIFAICFTSLFQKIFSIQMLYIIFFLIGFLITSLPSLILYWIERDLSLNDSLLRIILFTIITSEIICPVFLFHQIEQNVLFYFFIASCLLIILFIIILYMSKKWQINRSYRLLTTSMEMDEIEEQDNSDNENERSKGAKLH